MAKAKELQELESAAEAFDQAVLNFETWKAEHLTSKDLEELENFEQTVEATREKFKSAMRSAIERYPDNPELRKFTGDTFWADAQAKDGVNVPKLEEIFEQLDLKNPEGEPIRKVTDVNGLATVKEPSVKIADLKLLVKAGVIPEDCLKAIEFTGASVTFREGAREAA